MPPRYPLKAVARMMATYAVHANVGLTADDAGDGRLWGVVSDLDLATAASEDVEVRTAGGTAASPLLTVGPDETVSRATRLITEYQTVHVIVVDSATGRPRGVLSTLDVARVLAEMRP